MTTSDLLNDISTKITTNGTGQITGSVLNGVLTNMVNTLGGSGGSYFLFPNDATTPVGSDDIGKLVMDDGSGTAKVYTLSAATESVSGEWQVSFTSGIWAGLANTSAININQLSGDSIHIDKVQWRAGQTPASPLAELTLLKAAIDSYDLGLTVTLTDSNTMTISEGSPYQGFIINSSNMPDGAFSVGQLSLPAAPIAPTAFPLGKVLGLQDGNVMISAASVETYPFVGTLSLTGQNFNSATYSGLDFNDPSAFLAYANLLAVPAGGGSVTFLDSSIYNLDGTFPYSFRHQILGLILSTNSAANTVTVLHLNALSPILNFVLKMVWTSNLNS
ncbi:MAG: hypothetical protein JSS76_18970 [Bacteroidetes bacterium]|nr:hypothetical protein [Bacteroidota bacterium]